MKHMELRKKMGEPGFELFEWFYVKFALFIAFCLMFGLALFIAAAVKLDCNFTMERYEGIEKFNQLPLEERLEQAEDFHYEIDEQGLRELPEVPVFWNKFWEIYSYVVVICAVVLPVVLFGAYVNEWMKEPNEYFLADFPDEWMSKLFIVLTIPFWPVYIVSWLSVRDLKRQRKKEAEYNSRNNQI